MWLEIRYGNIWNETHKYSDNLAVWRWFELRCEILIFKTAHQTKRVEEKLLQNRSNIREK